MGSPSRYSNFPSLSTIYMICLAFLLAATFDVAFTLAGIHVLGISYEGNAFALLLHDLTRSHTWSIILGKAIGLSLVVIPSLLLLRLGYILTFYVIALFTISLQVVAGLTWIYVGLGAYFPSLLQLQTTGIVLTFLSETLRRTLFERRSIN